MTPASLRIGFFGIGLAAYWPQFPGLKERLEGYLGRVAAKLACPGVEIVNAGLVDSPPCLCGRLRVPPAERRSDIPACHHLSISSTVLPVVLRSKVPVIVLNLVPTPAIDYAKFNALGIADRIDKLGILLGIETIRMG